MYVSEQKAWSSRTLQKNEGDYKAHPGDCSLFLPMTDCVAQDGAGIIGVMLYTPDGIPIRTTVDNTTAAQYQNLVSHLTAAARSVVRDLDPTNDLTFFRISAV